LLTRKARENETGFLAQGESGECSFVGERQGTGRTRRNSDAKEID
jgi:hypothetical protein